MPMIVKTMEQSSRNGVEVTPSNWTQGRQNVKPPQNPLTGLSPKLSQVGLSPGFPTTAAEAAGLRSYLHPFHNTSSIQKRRQRP